MRAKGKQITSNYGLHLSLTDFIDQFDFNHDYNYIADHAHSLESVKVMVYRMEIDLDLYYKKYKSIRYIFEFINFGYDFYNTLIEKLDTDGFESQVTPVIDRQRRKIVIYADIAGGNIL